METVMNSAAPQPMSEDEEQRMRQRELLVEASEKATYHRIHAERFERIARGAAQALVALDDPSPVETVNGDALYESALKEREARRQDGSKASFAQSGVESAGVYSNG